MYLLFIYLKTHFWRPLNGQIISTIHNGSEPSEGRLQRHRPRWSIHDQVGDGRCEQSHHNLPNIFNITGKKDWIHPRRAAVMANQRNLNDKLTQIQDKKISKPKTGSLQDPEIKIKKKKRNTQN